MVGYNPPLDISLVVTAVGSSIVCPSSSPGVFQLVKSLPTSVTAKLQSSNRAGRKSNQTKICIVGATCTYDNQRYTYPKAP